MTALETPHVPAIKTSKLLTSPCVQLSGKSIFPKPDKKATTAVQISMKPMENCPFSTISNESACLIRRISQLINWKRDIATTIIAPWMACIRANSIERLELIAECDL
jgi:hypothetical protein